MSFPTGVFLIRNVKSGLVLDVRGSSTKEGADVLLYTKTSNPNQLWTYDSGFLINENSGLVLEVKGYESGGDITPGTVLVQGQRREPPDSINQLWAYNEMYLKPYDPKVVVAAQGDNLTAGTLAVVNLPTGFPHNDHQQWEFVSPS